MTNQQTMNETTRALVHQAKQAIFQILLDDVGQCLSQNKHWWWICSAFYHLVVMEDSKIPGSSFLIQQTKTRFPTLTWKNMVIDAMINS